jgi:uncharacterized membrane protein
VLETLYPWIKAFHVIAVISWMAAMLYLQRISSISAPQTGFRPGVAACR